MGGVARHGATGHRWRRTAVRLCWRHRRSKMKGGNIQSEVVSAAGGGGSGSEEVVRNGWRRVGGRSESRLKEEDGLCFIGSTTNGQNWLAEQVG